MSACRGRKFLSFLMVFHNLWTMLVAVIFIHPESMFTFISPPEELLNLKNLDPRGMIWWFSYNIWLCSECYSAYLYVLYILLHYISDHLCVSWLFKSSVFCWVLNVNSVLFLSFCFLNFLNHCNISLTMLIFCCCCFLLQDSYYSLFVEQPELAVYFKRRTLRELKN